MTWTEITFESQGRDKDTTDDSVSHNKDDLDDDGGRDYDWISLMRRFHSLAKHIITRQFWSAEWIMVGSIRDLKRSGEEETLWNYKTFFDDYDEMKSDQQIFDEIEVDENRYA